MKSKFRIVTLFLMIAMLACMLLGCPNRGGQVKPNDSQGSVSFSSTKSFTLKTKNNQKNWNGKLEYSLDNKTWIEWDGTEIPTEAITPSVGPDDENERYYLYLRGESNTYLSKETTRCFVITSTDNTNDIILNGNMKNLLDYKEAYINNITMENECFRGLFNGCEQIKTLGDNFELPFTTLSDACYSYMFNGCKNLISVPANLLPAEIMKLDCYRCMFQGCISLKTFPAQLRATELAESCYNSMFYDCTGLETIPANFLPATTLATRCYIYMFRNCSSLKTLPTELPATTLADYCYAAMFYNCTSLETIPDKFLKGTTLADSCYKEMFRGCSKLKISSDQDEGFTNELTISNYDGTTDATYYMFSDIPSLSDVTLTPLAGTYYVYNPSV